MSEITKKLKRLSTEQTRYSIDLQKLIEDFCSGHPLKGDGCYRHAEMLEGFRSNSIMQIKQLQIKLKQAINDRNSWKECALNYLEYENESNCE